MMMELNFFIIIIIIIIIKSCQILQATAFTQVEADESRRLLIGFTDVDGLGISKDLIVMDVKSIPTMERRVHASK